MQQDRLSFYPFQMRFHMSYNNDIYNLYNVIFIFSCSSAQISDIIVTTNYGSMVLPGCQALSSTKSFVCDVIT